MLGKDYGDSVFKYLDPPDAGRLECTFTRELVFTAALFASYEYIAAIGRKRLGGDVDPGVITIRIVKT